jgi:pimeloyl-ACP methyl ester carboxylesterase
VPGAAVIGHSDGAWIGLSYALHAPHRVRRLALLDPTPCFAGLPGVSHHELPMHPAAQLNRELLSFLSP